MIEFRPFIHRKDLQQEPETLFVFGDNMMRKGLGGQAAAMRGEPNAVGIPTKELPSMAGNAFLSDADFARWKDASLPDWSRLFYQARQGGKIVWPEAGIGTGRARLEKKAPSIAGAIKRNLAALQGLAVAQRTDLGS